MYFDGYILNTNNIFEINELMNKYKDKIEDLMFEEKIKDVSKILYSILINMQKGMSIEDSYKKSDILNNKYLKNYKDANLFSLVEYTVDQRHPDGAEAIYFIPVNYNNEQLLLCLFNIERNSVFEYGRENKFLPIKNEMSKIMKDFFYNSNILELPEGVTEDEWNYRKEIWSLATENDTYIKHSFQYQFRTKALYKIEDFTLIEKINEEIKKYAVLEHLSDDLFMEFEINEKLEITKLEKDVVEKKKKENGYNESFYQMELGRKMLKWTFNDFYNCFRKNK